MSRHGYSDCDGWQLIRWRGAVKKAITGKRGQVFLKDLLSALDALPEKKLIKAALINEGEVCAIGSVGVARGIDMSTLDVEDSDQIAGTFGIASALVRELEFINDEAWIYGEGCTPEQRFNKVRAWVIENIQEVGS